MAEDKAKGVCGQEKATQGSAWCYSDCRGEGGSGCPVLTSLSSSPAPFYAGTPSRGVSGAQGSSRQVSFIPRLGGVSRCFPHSGRGPQGAQNAIMLLETECRAPVA